VDPANEAIIHGEPCVAALLTSLWSAMCQQCTAQSKMLATSSTAL